jgi:hypothetical protein
LLGLLTGEREYPSDETMLASIATEKHLSVEVFPCVTSVLHPSKHSCNIITTSYFANKASIPKCMAGCSHRFSITFSHSSRNHERRLSRVFRCFEVLPMPRFEQSFYSKGSQILSKLSNDDFFLSMTNFFLDIIPSPRPRAARRNAGTAG